MKLLKIFLMLLIAILLIGSLLSLVFSASIKSTLLNQQFVENELEQYNFYSTLRNSVIGGNKGTVSEDKKVEEIIRASISEEWLKSQTNLVLSNFYDYINGKTKDADLKISFSEIKPEIKNNLLSEMDNLVPPGIKDNPQEVEMFKSNFETQIIEDIDTKLPDEINLLGEDQGKIKAMNMLKKYIYIFNLTFYGLIAFKAFLVVLAILILHKVKNIFRFMGGNYLATGIILFVASTLARFTLTSGIQKAEIPPTLEKEVILGLFSGILAPINMYNIIIVGVGILLLALSFIKFPSKKEQTKPTPVETLTN